MEKDNELKRQENLRRILAERKRNEFVTSGDFITNEHYFEFFKKHGYVLDGYSDNHISDYRDDVSFSDFREYRPWLNRKLVLLGTEQERGEYADGYYCPHAMRNPFVRYIELYLTELKIYTVEYNKGCEGFGSDEPRYCYRLEKDLSKEWVKYLTSICLLIMPI